MKFRDLISMCLSNLKRRKGRTFLTILGVTIGTCSIVIMMSFGFGMNEQQNKMIESMGNLRQITVYPQGEMIKDRDLESIRSIPGVAVISPKMNFSDESAALFAGSNDRYKVDYANIVGLDFEVLKEMGLTVLEGEIPATATPRKPKIIAGENLAFSFADSLRPEGSNTIAPYTDANGVQFFGYPGEDDDSITRNEPFFDISRTGLTLRLTSFDDPGSAGFRTPLEVAAVVKSDYTIIYETSEGLIMDINDMKDIRRSFYRDLGLPAPAASYPEAVVIADDVRNVESIEKQITSLGFYTSSQQSMRKAMEESMRSAQLMLGGLGAISFLVAAIGIANTMVMSVTERTREIGIMKSIGCRIQDIRLLFLSEAALIGLLGGMFGILVSEIACALINLFTSQVPLDSVEAIWQALSGYGTRLAVIPWQMIPVALLFAMAVGILSGYYPAQKATRISALEAIKAS